MSRGLRDMGAALSSALALVMASAAAALFWERRRRRRNSGLPDSDSAPLFGLVTGGGRGIYVAELNLHSRVEDAWLVIGGQVYDVTNWLEEHPGGKLILLAFAGRDASEPFQTVGHSALALREMKKLHRGHLLEGPLPNTYKADLPTARTRAATLTGGQKGIMPRAFSSLDDLRSLDAEVWEVSGHGFLPSSDPVPVEALKGTAFEPFADLADLLPGMGVTGALRGYIDSAHELQKGLLACGDSAAVDALSSAQCERAFAVVGYTMLAYWRAGVMTYTSSAAGGLTQVTCETELLQTLPAFLAQPMLAVSRRLGRPPMPDYAATVLYNWVRIDPKEPVSPSNIRCALRLTGLLDEEWFFKTHVVIEAEAVHVVRAVIGAIQAGGPDVLLDNLLALEEALWRVVRACLPIMYERSEDGTPKCSEHVFYQILRPLIKSGTLLFEGDVDATPRVLAGPSGAMSSILPCVDAALGIETTSQKLKELLTAFEVSMPKEHRKFLADLRAGMSIRKRIMLMRPVDGDPSSNHASLVRSFNRCIHRVLDFRWQHWQYVKNYIMKPGNISHAKGTGGTTFDFLQQHITDTENARLAETIGISTVATPTSDWPSFRRASVATVPKREFWSVDGEQGFLSREPMTWPSATSWAGELPEDVRGALVALWELATRMPALVACEGPFCEHVAGAKEKLAPLQDERALHGMSEAAKECIMSTLCHIAAGCVGARSKDIPKCIDRPLKTVARLLGRPPRLGVAELVLCNWCLQQSAAWDSNGDAEEETEQRRVVWRFLANPDEEWYRQLHIHLHCEARELVSAIRVGQVALSDMNDVGVVGSAAQLSAYLNRMCDFFDLQFDKKDSRTESVMTMRLEAFISHSQLHDLTLEETACWVYLSGSSPILPLVHAFLGVKIVASQQVDQGEGCLGEVLRCQLEEQKMFMPRAHRIFVEEMERIGMNLRRYSYRRFAARNTSVEKLHELEVAYNDALISLVRFLSRRMHLVCRFFPQMASRFGAYHSDVEVAMQKSRLELLKMRRRVDLCLDR